MSGGTPLPPFIRALPALDLPLPESQVTANAMRTEQGLAAFFTFHEDTDLPAHSHGDQWGTVLHGRMDVTRDGATEVIGPGASYFIPAGQVHAVKVAAGTVVLDVFAEPDRYPLKR